jgi:very-short-patch-repair endonuclease
VVHRSDSLQPRDVCYLNGLPATTPARALLDLASGLDRRDLEWAIDEAVQQRIVTVRALLDTARRATGHHGAGRLRQAAERHQPSGVTKSQAEKRYRALIRAAGLPEPLRNVKILGLEVDCYWPDAKLVVEVDSFRFHSTRPKFEHDSSKGARLVAAGLSVMRVTWYQMRDEPFAVVARTAQALARST